MSYDNVPEELSHEIRDASLDATRFIFEDPHQPWSARARVRAEHDLEPEINGITDTDF